jgi:hypothetical protein
MSQQLNLHLPDDLMRQIRQIAERTHGSIEAVTLDLIQRGVADSGNAISASNHGMTDFSDEDLWAVVDQRLTPEEDQAYTRLVEKGKSGALSAEEESELHRVVSTINQQMLERSKALLVLQQRGYNIKNGFLKTGKR